MERDRRMTNEEAKEIFLNRGFVNGLFDGDKWRQSIVVISKWLQQEPCEDCISREAVIDVLTKHRVHFVDMVAITSDLKDLPSVQPMRPKGEWTLSSKKMPEESGYYLVSGGGKVWICKMFDSGYLKGWCNDARNPVVEAWMPLPTPYEPQESE